MTIDVDALVQFALWTSPVWEAGNSDDEASARAAVDAFLSERREETGSRSATERVLTAIGRLQDETAGTPLEPLVTELVAAMADDTTAIELRQEIEFLRAEYKLGARPDAPSEPSS